MRIGWRYTKVGFCEVLRYSDSPRWLKTLAKYFPGIVRRTMLGSLVRLMYIDNYQEDWRAEYLLSRIDPNYHPMPRDELQRRYKAAIATLSVDDIIDSVSIPLYVHSLELISRDFPRIPIFAVFQPMEHPLEQNYARMTRVIPQKVNDEDLYKKIQFFNYQHVWERNNLGPGSFVDGIHLSNKGHELVAEYLSEDLLPFVKNRCSTLLSSKADAPPHEQ